jgi:hypothetical protein
VLCRDVSQGRVGTIIAGARSERAEREARSQALRDADAASKGHTMLQTLVSIIVWLVGAAGCVFGWGPLGVYGAGEGMDAGKVRETEKRIV